MVTNIERYVHQRFARSAEKIAIVIESVVDDPNVSIPRRSQELGLSFGTLWHILHLQAVDGNFSNKVFFNDEAHFTLGGYVYKQNYRIWGSENPQIIQEKPLHPEKVIVI